MKIAAMALGILIFCSEISLAQVNGFEVMNNPVKQGNTVLIRILPQWQGPFVCVSVFGKHYSSNGNGYVFVGVSVYENPGKKTAYLVECGREVHLGYQPHEEIIVLKNEFQKTRTAGSSVSGRPRKNNERIAIDNAFSPANVNAFDMTRGEGYDYPVFARNVIDSFGLIYRNNGQLPHYGVDLKLPVGTKIRSIAQGKVVLVAKDYSKEGNMVIINHGLGIFSVYMHLSRIDVQDGDIVTKGQTIGLSGATGAGVREPHLHFNIKIRDTYVDPLDFLMMYGTYFKRPY